MQDYTFVNKLHRKDAYLYKSNDTGELFEVFKVYQSKIIGVIDFPFFKPIHKRFEIDDATWVLMEYTPKQNLQEILSVNVHIEEPYLRVLFNEVCRIVSVLHKAKLTGWSFEPENLIIGKGGEIQIDNYFKMEPQSLEKHYLEDLERLIDFIYRISRLDRSNPKEQCVSRKFSDFLGDLAKFPCDERPASEQIEMLRQHKFLTSHTKKIDMLLDLIDEVSENSIGDDCGNKTNGIKEESIFANNRNDLLINSEGFDRPETSGSKAIENDQLDMKTTIDIIEDSFAKQLSMCYEDKITYKALTNIKKNLIELSLHDPNCLKDTINSYLNYRQLLPKFN